MIFLLGSVSAALTWDTQYTYDNHNDASVNQTLWSNSTTGSASKVTFSEGGSALRINVATDITFDTASGTFISDIFPNIYNQVPVDHRERSLLS